MSGQQFYGQSGCGNQQKGQKQTLKGQCRAHQGPGDEGNKGTGRYNKVPNFTEQSGDISDGYELTHEQKMLDQLRRMRQDEAEHIRQDEAHIKREKEYMKAFDDEYEIVESDFVNRQNKKY